MEKHFRRKSEFKCLHDKIISRYDEIKKYDFENVENNKYMQIGHFSQVVWKRATKMGIGKASANGKCFVVGQYDAGNYGSTEALKNNVKKPL